MISEFKRLWKYLEIAQFDVLSWNLPVRTEGKKKNVR
jgi:hypothetical protein